MRLSEARIRHLSKRIAREMQSTGAARSSGGSDDLAFLVGKVLMRDQRAEAQIEAEARQMLAKQKRLPPPGTGEYQAAFQQAKQTIAARKGFVF